MGESISHFQYFVDVFWPFFLGAIAVRVICGFYGDLKYWVKRALGFDGRDV